MQTTRSGFLKSVAGMAIAGVVLRRPADGLLYAQEKAHVSPRSTRVRDVEIVPYSLEQKVVFHVALPVPGSACAKASE